MAAMPAAIITGLCSLGRRRSGAVLVRWAVLVQAPKIRFSQKALDIRTLDMCVEVSSLSGRSHSGLPDPSDLASPGASLVQSLAVYLLPLRSTQPICILLSEVTTYVRRVDTFFRKF